MELLRTIVVLSINPKKFLKNMNEVDVMWNWYLNLVLPYMQKAALLNSYCIRILALTFYYEKAHRNRAVKFDGIQPNTRLIYNISLLCKLQFKPYMFTCRPRGLLDSIVNFCTLDN